MYVYFNSPPSTLTYTQLKGIVWVHGSEDVLLANPKPIFHFRSTHVIELQTKA